MSDAALPTGALPGGTNHRDSVAIDEAAAITQFVGRERRGLLRTAVLLVGSRAEAEEAVQEALAATAERWATVERPAAYAHTSVVNACRMVLRRRDLARSREHLFGPPPNDMPSELAELLSALETLSERQRVAIVLRYLVDLTDDDIAAALDCRPATVRSLIRRGLARLRKDLT